MIAFDHFLISFFFQYRQVSPVKVKAALISVFLLTTTHITMCNMNGLSNDKHSEHYHLTLHPPSVVLSKSLQL